MGDPRPSPWWSVTKTAIAACALRLSAQDRINLDATLPNRPYTLRHLPGHTSGLGCYPALPDYHEAVAARSAAWSSTELIERVGGTVGRALPWVYSAYSNLGYLLAEPSWPPVSWSCLTCRRAVGPPSTGSITAA
ncbi:MAG: serine hydrolase domain-containing protein [Jannaschia sp.]